MSLPKVQIIHTTETLTIRIGGFVHLYLVGEIEGFQASKENYYEIEFYRDKKDVIICQYERKELWLKILQLLEKQLIKKK